MSSTGLAGELSPSLWRNGEFMRLWFAQAVSRAGTAVTEVALPLTAVLVLDATPGQMATLVVAGQLPNLLFGLLAGVWVDRARRRPVLVGSDLARLLLFASIPAAAALGLLTLAQLWIIAFAAATFSLFSLVASVSVLPTIVPASQLIEANSRLQATDAVVTIGGQGLGGVLVQLIGAPKALIADAASYLVSAMSLRGVARHERQPDRDKRSRIAGEVAEGVRELFRTPVLRAIAISAAVGAFAGAVQATVLMLYFANTLGLSPAVIGVVFASTALGSVAGAAVAGRTSRRFGVGPMIIGGAFLLGVSAVLLPLADVTGATVPMLVAGQFLAGLGLTVYRINQVSLRQAVTPRRLLGRVTSARTFIIFCVAPLGAILGGYLGAGIGIQPALFIAAAVMFLQVIGLVASPVRHVRTATAVA